MATPLDDHGQPAPHFNASRRAARAINELIGLLRGIIADNYINEEECEKLAHWILVHEEVIEHWPLNVIAQRLDRIYADKRADDDERADLAELVNQIVGRVDEDSFSFGPTDLPLTIPAPEVVFDRCEFVFTGRFMYGPRKICQREVEVRGGRCADDVHLQTNYLVIGALTSRDWKFSSFGNKILKAVEYQKRSSIFIINEQHWESFLRTAKAAAAR